MEPLDVLLIDSHSDVLGYMIERVLDQHGYEAHVEAYDTQEKGLNAVKPAGEQIVLCAVGSTPQWSSTAPRTMIESVKSRNPDAKVVIFTGSSYTKSDAGEDGADGYLPKPVDAEEIMNTIEKVIAGTFWEK